MYICTLLLRSAGWGIVWKLLLSRLGLFKEIFSGSEGKEADKKHPPKSGTLHSPRTVITPARSKEHTDTRQRHALAAADKTQPSPNLMYLRHTAE